MLFADVYSLHSDYDADGRIGGGRVEEFRNSVMAICIVSAVVSLVGNLVSGSRLKNQVKLILELVVTVTVISPFISGKSSLELPEISGYEVPDSSYSLELYNDTLRQTASRNISEVLIEQITAAGISCEKIEAEVNISADGSIFISRVKVSADDFSRAADIVRTCLGTETEVIDEKEE